jgi:hypothetical protein
MKPQTRRSGLLIRELPDELLVYDRDHHRAHCLNRTAALVFRHADGTRTPADLTRLLGPAGAADEGLVRLALQQLAAAGLLKAGPSAAQDALPAEGMSRREVARRVGIAAAILLPAVVSIVAPTPAEAAATCVTDCLSPLQPPGTPCTTTVPPCVQSCDGAGNCV